MFAKKQSRTSIEERIAALKEEFSSLDARAHELRASIGPLLYDGNTDQADQADSEIIRIEHRLEGLTSALTLAEEKLEQLAQEEQAKAEQKARQKLGQLIDAAAEQNALMIEAAEKMNTALGKRLALHSEISVLSRQLGESAGVQNKLTMRFVLGGELWSRTPDLAKFLGLPR